jgi:hypothetical protein
MVSKRHCEPPCDEHYSCRLKQNVAMVAPSAMPSRYHHGALRKPKQPSWERGIATESRPGGAVMPYINEKGDKVRVKEFGQRRHEIAAIRDRQRNAPRPL